MSVKDRPDLGDELFGRRLKVARVAGRMQQRELAKRLGKSVNSISRYEKGVQRAPKAVLIALGQILGVGEGYFTEEEEGRALEMLGMREEEVRRMRGLPRGARGVKVSEMRLPVLGRVPAGDMEEAIEEAREYMPATEEHAEVADFVLRVEGDSMYPLLVEGDLVGVRMQGVAQSGQVVVARVGNEAGVKVYRRDSLGERLESANPVYAPVQGPFEIVGVVAWMHRNMTGKKDRLRA